MAEHDIAPLGERHPLHNWEYADATARLAATGFIPADVTKWAKQLDDGSYWELTDDSPATWAQRTGGGGALTDDSVTNAKLANMAQSTIKGRAAGAGTGDPTDLSATQATAILNAMVGDSGAGGTKGLAPAPAAGDAAAGKFLSAGGGYTVPSGIAINTTDNRIPYRSNSTTFADSFLANDAANGQTTSILGHIMLSQNNGKAIGWGNTTIAFGGFVSAGQGAVQVIADDALNPGSLIYKTATPPNPGGNPTPWSANGMNFRQVLTTSAWTVGNPGQHGGNGTALDGYRFIMQLVQDATGGRTVAWGSDYRFIGSVTPTLSTAANAVDTFEFICYNDIAYEISRSLQQTGVNALLESLEVFASDLVTALTTGTGKGVFFMPYAMTATEVFAGLATPQTSGSIFTVDINEAGSTILSTKITIDNTEDTSLTAATPPVISDAALAKGAKITIDIDQIGDGTAKGLVVVVTGIRG